MHDDLYQIIRLFSIPLRGKASYMTVTVCIWPIRNCKFNPQQQDFQINKKIALQAPCILCNDHMITAT